MNNHNKPSIWRSLGVGLVTFLGLAILAYGFQVTRVDLEELRSENRQQSLVRVMRALASPEIFAYDQVEEIVNHPIYVPCQPGSETPVVAQDSSQPYVVLTPGCAAPGETVQVEGFNFAPFTTGPVRFVPGSDPNNIVTLGRENATTDADGYFVLSLQMPDRPSDDVQYIRVLLRRNVGAVYFSRTALETWDKIVETVFLALLATIIGTILAIPLSFIAARNLMKSVKSPLASIALSVLGWPIGIVLGYVIVNWIGTFSTTYASATWLNLVSVIVSPVAISYGLRWALPQEERPHPSLGVQFARMVVVFVSVLLGFFGLFQLANLAMSVGTYLQSSLGSFGFLGYFLFQLGDIVLVITPVLGALAAGGTVGNFFGRIGQFASEKLALAALKGLNLILTPLAGALILGLLGQAVEWLYVIGDQVYTLWLPAGVGAALGLLLALFTSPKESLPIGLVIYTVTRTLLNGLRSVEALVMAIVFVIAVGIGPFAGVMALGLHTIVSLAKLYSEQVESIASGPLEAIEATGANRLQTIIYAVIPQIVPPYISYTMYRWDINVRMSTIIGFVGGGGIGFLLQQNINLLNYTAASTQMLAIAVVVSLMDYISSEMRERVV